MLLRRIELLKPEVRGRFESFITALEREGFRYSILETLRTIKVQEAYFAQGREPLAKINERRQKAGLHAIGAAEGKRIITQTMQSIHLEGRAADIVPIVDGRIPWNIDAGNADLWLTFGRLGQEAGLVWGGTWTPLNKFGIGWDAPHYQV
jgi:peptidoglycan L-alanyl-D-glutamate endopeptidase CwlK